VTSAALVLVLAATPGERMLADADGLAARARAAPEEKKEKLVEEALRAYAAVLEAYPKDRELVPRVRRRRAALLQHAGRLLDALGEHDAILAGRARRKDKARALFDGAVLLERGGDLHAAERRFLRAIEEFKDVDSVRGKAMLARAALLHKSGRTKAAVKAYRQVAHDCRHQEKLAIRAYDELALIAIGKGDRKGALRWLKACTSRYAERAARGDKFGDYLARLLGEMKAPALLGR